MYVCMYVLYRHYNMLCSICTRRHSDLVMTLFTSIPTYCILTIPSLCFFSEICVAQHYLCRLFSPPHSRGGSYYLSRYDNWNGSHRHTYCIQAAPSSSLGEKLDECFSDQACYYYKSSLSVGLDSSWSSHIFIEHYNASTNSLRYQLLWSF